MCSQLKGYKLSRSLTAVGARSRNEHTTFLCRYMQSSNNKILQSDTPLLEINLVLEGCHMLVHR